MKRDTGTYNILVVEDNPGDYFLVADYLEEEIVAPNVKQAVSLAEAGRILKNLSFDIILLDLTLPDKQGEPLIREVLKLAREIPVIILTGFTDVNFAIQALALGASDYLLKDNLNSQGLYKSIVYNLERNKYVKRLKESEQRYSDLFHLSPMPMWVHSLSDLRILDANRAAVLHYGYSREELLTMAVSDLMPATKGKKALRQGEAVHWKKNGEKVIMDIRLSQLEYNGQAAALALAADVTQRRKHMRAIEIQNRKLREIAWTQSHIVRAPLARILGLVQLMELEETPNEEWRKIFEHIRDSSSELDRVIQNIIKISQSLDS